VNEALRAVMAQLRELRSHFADVHRLGVEALDRHDLAGFDAAIHAESAIIDELRRLIAEFRSVTSVDMTRWGSLRSNPPRST